MIKRLIEDVDKSLDTESYMATLPFVITLPDICVKVGYSDF